MSETYDRAFEAIIANSLTDDDRINLELIISACGGREAGKPRLPVAMFVNEYEDLSGALSRAADTNPQSELEQISDFLLDLYKRTKEFIGTELKIHDAQSFAYQAEQGEQDRRWQFLIPGQAVLTGNMVGYGVMSWHQIRVPRYAIPPDWPQADQLSSSTQRSGLAIIMNNVQVHMINTDTPATEHNEYPQIFLPLQHGYPEVEAQ